MRFETNGQNWEFTTTNQDKEIIDAAGDTVQSVVKFAQAIGMGDRGECNVCDEDSKVLRPMLYQLDEGGFTTIGVCRSCQEDMVTNQLQQARQAQQESNDVELEVEKEAEGA